MPPPRVSKWGLDSSGLASTIDLSICDIVNEAAAVRVRAARSAVRASSGPWRCHVCTLAYGTCEHSPHWFARRVTRVKKARERRLNDARREIARVVNAGRPASDATVDDADFDEEERLFLDDIYGVVASLPSRSAVDGDDGATRSCRASSHPPSVTALLAASRCLPSAYASGPASVDNRADIRAL